MFLLQYDTFAPEDNLALEEALMEEVRYSGHSWLRLWRNRPALIVGRFQCVPAEINLVEARVLDVPVVRRLTGGGAVYHDLGNLNYSLMVPASNWNEEGFRPLFQPLREVLARWGVIAGESGRNDLTINGGKFSGAAICRKNGVVLAHACLLYDTDLSRMARLLTVAPGKLAHHGVQSVQARVTNLKEWLPPELNLKNLAGELAEAFAARAAAAPERLLTRARALIKDKYSSWNWNIGSSPFFTRRLRRRFAWGSLELFFNIEAGMIKEVKIQGDFFGPGPEPLEAALTGLPYEPRIMRAALASLDLAHIFPGAQPEEILGFVGP